jgi:hypothetical protein
MSIVLDLDLMSDDIEHLAPAIRLCMGVYDGGQKKARQASFWSKAATDHGGESVLIFYWTEPDATAPSATAFPAPLDADDVVTMVKAWLRDAPRGPEPDIDGSVGQGFRVTTIPPGLKECGLHGANSWTVLFAVTTEWAEYHK